MAGVKGRSGGARPGAGRPRKSKPEAEIQKDAGDPPAEAVERFDDPLAYLLHVMNDAGQEPRLRVRAAVAAAQYLHTKTHDGGKKDGRQEAAKKAASGRFAPKAPPKLVVNNRG